MTFLTILLNNISSSCDRLSVCFGSMLFEICSTTINDKIYNGDIHFRRRVGLGRRIPAAAA